MYLTTYLKYAGIFVLLITLQVTFVGYLLSIPNYNITPDIVILFVIYLGFVRGHIVGAVSGFIAGLTVDILSGSFIGLLALSYAVAGFIAGYFQGAQSERASKKGSFASVMFLCTLIAYTIFYLVYFQGSSMNFFEIFLKHIITTTLYTSVFGLIFALLFNRFELKKTF